jgi:hypothetical protein
MSNNSTKEVNLLGRDFGGLRLNLIDFAKQYYPNTYNDFNESSPGMMFMEMASYVGDVLSYYTDVQLRESILEQAKERKNVISLAQSFGYTPKLYSPSTTTLSVYQLVPAVNSLPDLSYALVVKEGMQVTSTSNPNVVFTTKQKVDFSYSSSFSDPLEVSVYQIGGSNNPTRFLLKKKVDAISGELVTRTFTFGTPRPYDKINISEEGLIDVVSITDSNGDLWTKVDFLGQQTIFEQVRNISANNTGLENYSQETPYVLKLKKIPKRYITRIEDDGSLSIQFGSGLSTNMEDLVPDPKLNLKLDNIVNSIDPSNFLYTAEYGLAPANTTLTVVYRVGTGVGDNVPARDLSNISSVTFDNTLPTSSPAVSIEVLASLAAVNEEPSSGGKFSDTVEEIRQQAISFFPTQNRAVTLNDYTVRAYSLPPQFGSVSKVYVIPDYKDRSTSKIATLNGLGLNLFVLGKNNVGSLANLNPATKQNLKNYMSFYRILTDALNILDGNIINIGVEFEIVVLPNYNANEVLLRCVSELKNYFNIDKWQINQPILLSDIYVLLDKVNGVQTVVRPSTGGDGGLQIVNKYGGEYSEKRYNIKNATRNGIIYPAKDPAIFEVKFPDVDIKGRVVPLF